MKKVTRDEIITNIQNNEIVIMPTDTVYGLMIKASRENEIKLNKFKHSDINKKISIIFPTVKDLLNVLDKKNTYHINMIKEKLPGKYTFIVNLKKDYTKKLGFNRSDFGVRVTSNQELQNILKQTEAVLATSCNYSKEDICITENDIKKIFTNEKINYYFTENGTSNPSTIIDLTQKNINIIR